MHLRFVIVALACIAGALGEVCPPAEDLYPCECEEDNLRIYCNEQSTTVPLDLKVMFDRISPMIPEDFVFETLFLYVTNLKEIPAGAIQTVKFKSILIESNYELTYIHPDAFNATLETTTKLTIASNRYLTNEGEGHTPDDLFNVVRKFKNVEELAIHHNSITSIPDDALGTLPNLTNFRYGSGNLKSIGSRPFAGLPKLNYVELGYSDISVNEIAVDSFEGIGSDAEVNLEHNPFSRLPEAIFKPLLDRARKVRVGGQDCYFFCTDVQLDCDEESAWICEDVEKYEQVLTGFVCRSDSAYDNIFQYCRLQKGNKAGKLLSI